MEDELKSMVIEAIELQTDILKQESILMQDNRFRQFIERQKIVQEQIANIWKSIEQSMIENNVKSIKGSFGSLTIVSKKGYDIDTENLPQKYFKKVPDTSKIGKTIDLTDKPIPGVSLKEIKYLRKNIK